MAIQIQNPVSPAYGFIARTFFVFHQKQMVKPSTFSSAEHTTTTTLPNQTRLSQLPEKPDPNSAEFQIRALNRLDDVLPQLVQQITGMPEDQAAKFNNVLVLMRSPFVYQKNKDWRPQLRQALQKFCQKQFRTSLASLLTNPPAPWERVAARAKQLLNSAPNMPLPVVGSLDVVRQVVPVVQKLIPTPTQALRQLPRGTPFQLPKQKRSPVVTVGPQPKRQDAADKKFSNRLNLAFSETKELRQAWDKLSQSKNLLQSAGDWLRRNDGSEIYKAAEQKLRAIKKSVLEKKITLPQGLGKVDRVLKELSASHLQQIQNFGRNAEIGASLLNVVDNASSAAFAGTVAAETLTHTGSYELAIAAGAAAGLVYHEAKGEIAQWALQGADDPDIRSLAASRQTNQTLPEKVVTSVVNSTVGAILPGLSGAVANAAKPILAPLGRIAPMLESVASGAIAGGITMPTTSLGTDAVNVAITIAKGKHNEAQLEKNIQQIQAQWPTQKRRLLAARERQWDLIKLKIFKAQTVSFDNYKENNLAEYRKTLNRQRDDVLAKYAHKLQAAQKTQAKANLDAQIKGAIKARTDALEAYRPAELKRASDYYNAERKADLKAYATRLDKNYLQRVSKLSLQLEDAKIRSTRKIRQQVNNSIQSVPGNIASGAIFGAATRWRQELQNKKTYGLTPQPASTPKQKPWAPYDPGPTASKAERVMATTPPRKALPKVLALYKNGEATPQELENAWKFAQRTFMQGNDTSTEVAKLIKGISNTQDFKEFKTHAVEADRLLSQNMLEKAKASSQTGGSNSNTPAQQKTELVTPPLHKPPNELRAPTPGIVTPATVPFTPLQLTPPPQLTQTGPVPQTTFVPQVQSTPPPDQGQGVAVDPSLQDRINDVTEAAWNSFSERTGITAANLPKDPAAWARLAENDHLILQIVQDMRLAQKSGPLPTALLIHLAKVTRTPVEIIQRIPAIANALDEVATPMRMSYERKPGLVELSRQEHAMRQALQYYQEQLLRKLPLALTPEGARIAEQDAREAAQRHLDHQGLTAQEYQLARLALKQVFARLDVILWPLFAPSKLTDKLNVPNSNPGTTDAKVTLQEKSEAFNRMLELLDIHVQPQYEIILVGDSSIQKKLVGVEVLLNFRPDANGNREFPDKVITLANEVGRMEELTEEVMQATFALANKRPDLPKIAFNVPPEGLTPKFLQKYKENMARYPEASQRVGVEVTEEGEIKPENVLILRKLHALGVRLSFDDFGAQSPGVRQSHFERLLIGRRAYQLEYGQPGNLFETVKLDGPFVKEKSNLYLQLTVRLLKKLGVEHILAERNEKEKHTRYLFENGVRRVQGWDTGKKMSPNELPVEK